jgi:hypothetical protein
VGLVSGSDVCVDPDKVLNQSPAAGAPVRVGATVYVSVDTATDCDIIK